MRLLHQADDSRESYDGAVKCSSAMECMSRTKSQIAAYPVVDLEMLYLWKGYSQAALLTSSLYTTSNYVAQCPCLEQMCKSKIVLYSAV